ncbi:unnamed protein product [Owenia fusiformis]|uniref:Uncharacterized protein n=1 Tax=Owenia fusiformis TaxID=6347 RepID=A0A8J1TS93_OWEFU|nr:unnamed protein product [Owenia fusiformis]
MKGSSSPWFGLMGAIYVNFPVALQFVIRCIFMNDWATLRSTNATTGLTAQEQRMGIFYMCDQIGEDERVCQSTTNMPFPHSYKAAGALAIVACILLVLGYIAFLVGACSLRKRPNIFSGKYFAAVSVALWVSTFSNILSYTIFGTYIETTYYHVRPFYDSTLSLGGWYQMMAGSASSLVVAIVVTIFAGMMGRCKEEKSSPNGQTNAATEMGSKY